MNRIEFEQIIMEAVETLPESLQSRIENVTFEISFSTQREETHGLYGLYEGVPLGDRGIGYNMALPDRITLFQDTLERDFPSREEMIRGIRETVLHELGHYFGLDDEQLDDLGIG
jgi:predicted Zn-dependent protease with MMP-like domain|tara:strand:+ start:384 stop:728 length:345 start_codon:yes stop_codon:yes gene_type:complete